MKEHKINKSNLCISGWYIDKQICDDLILHFENSDKKITGTLYGSNGKAIVDKNKKASTDLPISIFDNTTCIQNYLIQLTNCVQEFKKQYIYSDIQQDKWSLCEGFNIQKYKPSESYSQWHFENSGLNTIYRFLTFMTYLNDVNEGGETEWFYKNLKIKPEKGLTVIWGTTWETTHRGIPAPKEDKYIATGWYGYNKD